MKKKQKAIYLLKIYKDYKLMDSIIPFKTKHGAKQAAKDFNLEKNNLTYQIVLAELNE